MNSTSDDSAESGPQGAITAWIPLSATTLNQFRQDAPLYAVVGVYALIAWLLSLYLGDGQKYRPFQYIISWTAISILILTIMGAARATWFNPSRPLSSFVSLGKRHWNLHFVRRFPLILATGTFYGVFTSVKNMLPDMHPFIWDPVLAAIDYRMLGNHDGWRLVASIIPDGFLLRAMDAIYGWGWLALVMSLSAYVAISPAMQRHRRQFFLAFFSSWIFAGNILACAFMSGGPSFYAKFTGDNLRFASLLQSVSGTGAAAIQDYLWNIYIGGSSFLGAGISAFPSVHMVSMALVTLLFKKVNMYLFWVGIFLTILMELGSVRLGWHYVSDGVAGIAIAVIIWRLTRLTERSTGHRKAAPGIITRL